jgi:hypothetical protein
VFNQVKIAKPQKLFLIQDGSRINNEEDSHKILQCREIVSKVDWNCEIYRNYSEHNQGCAERPFSGISWVFTIVDEAIFLEDDCVPNQEFFLFCSEMLKLYKKDLRIGLITGTNHLDSYNFNDYSYGFVKSGSIWGWATWKDRWKLNDFKMSNFEDKYGRKLVFNGFKDKYIANERIKTWKLAKSKIEKGFFTFWDYQWGYTRHYNSFLSIIPKNNLISNIGIGFDSTHSGKNFKKMPKKISNLFFKLNNKSIYPLIHPPSVLMDENYDNLYYKRIYPSIFEKHFSSIIYFAKRLFKSIF